MHLWPSKSDEGTLEAKERSRIDAQTCVGVVAWEWKLDIVSPHSYTFPTPQRDHCAHLEA